MTAAPSSTIRQLLRATATQNNLLVDNDRVQIYRFADTAPELQHYLLRVQLPPHTSLRAALKSATSLTPVTPLVAGMHIGQPLLALDNAPFVTIIPKQEGMSLADWKEQLAEKYAHTEAPYVYAKMEMMEHLLGLADNPFTNILDEAYRLERNGRETDYTSGNVLLSPDGKTLSVIDQDEPELLNPKSPFTLAPSYLHLTTIFDIGQRTSPELAARYEHIYAPFKQKIIAAWREVNARYRDIPEPLAFAEVSDIQGVALQSPPHQLVLQLNRLAQRAGIERSN